jgi:Ala-tRNA(Pro) deacylase
MATIPGTEELFDLFKQLNIAYTILAHEPLFTSDQATEVAKQLPWAHPKNLFLYDKKNPNRLFLLSVVDTKRLDINRFAKMVGVTGMSFAKAETLKQLLGVAPGSVTPLGLFHDHTGQISYYIDSDLLAHADISIHPLRNDHTVTLDMQDFLRFCSFTKHAPTIITVPTKS